MKMKSNRKPPRPTMKQRLSEALRERDAASQSAMELVNVLNNIRQRALDLSETIRAAIDKVRKGK